MLILVTAITITIVTLAVIDVIATVYVGVSIIIVVAVHIAVPAVIPLLLIVHEILLLNLLDWYYLFFLDDLVSSVDGDFSGLELQGLV